VDARHKAGHDEGEISDQDMIPADCPDCGEPVAAFAKACPHCGAPNPSRRAGFVIGGSLVLLIAAVAVAVFAVFRGAQLPTEPPPDATTDDFGWLREAMQKCDDEAAATPSTLHFLVIPLSPGGRDLSQWQRKSLNDVGNAVALASDEALSALRNGDLKISTERYYFRVRDEGTKSIYEWSLSTGVKRFSAPDADAVSNFSVQFLDAQRGGTDKWGAVFGRRKGNCSWVNAILNPSRSPQ
jgi:hypothetical protein